MGAAILTIEGVNAGGGGVGTEFLQHSIRGVDLEDMTNSGKDVLEVRVQTWVYWAGWGKREF